MSNSAFALPGLMADSTFSALPGLTALTIDGSIQVGSSAASSSCACGALSTSLTKDIIVVGVVVEQTAATTVSSISDGASLTWQKLTSHNVTGGGSPNVSVEMWWAYSSGTLSSDVITANLSGSADACTICAVAINGCHNFLNPWDANVNALVTNTVTTPAANVEIDGISSTGAHTMLIAMFGEGYYSDFNFTPDSSAWTVVKAAIGGASNKSIQIFEAQPFSTALSNYSVLPKFSGVTVTSQYFVGIAAALTS